MGRKRRENPLIEGLEITAVAAEGKAMGHVDGKVVFVPLAVPGDVVDVQITAQRRRFMEGRIVGWKTRSQAHVEPFCEHFGVCGGCSWQNLPYSEQLRFKQQQVEDQLRRIGHIELPDIQPIIGSARTVFYRNKLEFTFAPKRWLTKEEFQITNYELRAENIESQCDSQPAAAPSGGLKITASEERGLVRGVSPASDSNARDNKKCCARAASHFFVSGVADCALTEAAKAGIVQNVQLGLGGEEACKVRPDHGKSALGFHVPKLFDKVLDVRKCWLQPDPSNAIRLEIKQFCTREGYEFYDIRQHTGLMRNVVVRTASTGETMVIVVFARPDTERINALLGHLRAVFGTQITSLMYIVNEKLNDSLTDQTAILHSGRDHIFEQMDARIEPTTASGAGYGQILRFKIGPKSFYQTNSEQALELYKVAREFAELTGSETVYDLYTGTGTIANFVAAGAAQVVGIEYVSEAIDDARENSALNSITNTIFYAGDMKRILTDDFVAANGRPDVVILDPPRAGVDAPVVDVILRAAPRVIVYVSCNPATQARDIALMCADYQVVAVQPVDMFPHTHHVENVVKLVRCDAAQALHGGRITQ